MSEAPASPASPYSGMLNVEFAWRASSMAALAQSWASGALYPPSYAYTPMRRAEVVRFADEMRRRLAEMEARAIGDPVARPPPTPEPPG